MLGDPGPLVHRRRAVQHRLHVEPLQRGGKQADGGELGGAPADPVPHREARHEALVIGDPVQLAAGLGDGDGVGPEVEAVGPVAGGRLQHPVAGLGGPARLGDDDRQRAVEAVADAVQHAGDAVGVGVVEEVRAQPFAGPAQRLGDELRPQRRAADADQQVALERLAARCEQRTVAHLGGEGHHLVAGRLDRLPGGVVRARGGSPQPVVADLAPLVRIGDLPRLEGPHLLEGPGEGCRERGDDRLVETGAGDVEPEAERLVVEQPFAVTLPTLGEAHRVIITALTPG